MARLNVRFQKPGLSIDEVDFERVGEMYEVSDGVVQPVRGLVVTKGGRRLVTEHAPGELRQRTPERSTS